MKKKTEQDWDKETKAIMLSVCRMAENRKLSIKNFGINEQTIYFELSRNKKRRELEDEN
jgi:hypothetical protein|tara:strand:+ start:2376 stop:2552 length:177 start_codon:yes stop_codon:yes gene_type:complete